MNNKIIVTGGCGYIGSHTVIELIKNGYDVVIFDDLSNSTKKTNLRIYQITGIKPIFIQVDLKDLIATNRAFEAHKDACGVIHFAAHKAVSDSVKQPLKYYKNNLYSLINTLESQIAQDINNIIFSSSATVYGLPDVLPVSEKSTVKRPSSPYGNTKKIGEEIIQDLTSSIPKFSGISLRYFNPIGAHESGIIGELATGVPNNLMPYITQTASGIRNKLMVFGGDYPTKDGTAIRDYIHVVDLAKAHVIALSRLLNKKQDTSFEVFNLGSAKGYSVLEMIKAFESISKVSLNYEITDRREGDVSQLYASTQLVEEKMGWKAQKGIDEMISSAWKWEQHLRSQKNEN